MDGSNDTPPVGGAPEPGSEPLVPWGAPPPSLAATDAPVGALARLVAYFIDALVVSILPMLPMLAAFSSGLVDLRSPGFDPTDPAAFQAWMESFATAIRPYAVGASVGSVALSFVYFVGFWTSGGQATPGMRVVRFRLADAATGGALTLGQAVKRWAALGVPFTLFGVVPLAGLADIASAVPFWQLLVLITVATDPAKLGIHDKFARTRMERVPAGGPLRVALGCGVLLLVYVALSFGFAVVLGSMAVNAAGSL